MKIAFTGAQGTGKTTSCYKLAHDLKIKYPNKTVMMLNENASDCPLPINKNATQNSQLWIFTNQIRREIELCTRYDIVVCDRTIADAIAYTTYMQYRDLSDIMLDMCLFHLDTYDFIVYKDVDNDYGYDDGIRDISFRSTIDGILKNIYFKLRLMNTKYTEKFIQEKNIMEVLSCL